MKRALTILARGLFWLVLLPFLTVAALMLIVLDNAPRTGKI